MIATCSCKSEYQDNRYGPRMRVFNPRKDEGNYRCTICGGERQIAKSSPNQPGKIGRGISAHYVDAINILGKEKQNDLYVEEETPRCHAR